jgi:hypothetical protein
MQTRANQTGNILVPLMPVGLVCALLMTAIIQQSLYLEAVAVENSLAETRAYWASMGHFRYAMSRTRHAALCPNQLGCLLSNKFHDTEYVPVLQSYLDEISTLRTFTYPDENSGYFIKINVVAAPDDDPSRHTYSGHLMMTSSYPTAGVSLLPILSGAAQRFSPYQFRVCTGLASNGAPCGVISTNIGGRAGFEYQTFVPARLDMVAPRLNAAIAVTILEDARITLKGSQGASVGRKIGCLERSEVQTVTFRLPRDIVHSLARAASIHSMSVSEMCCELLASGIAAQEPGRDGGLATLDWPWNAPADRITRCRLMATEALTLAGRDQTSTRKFYLNVAKQWTELANEIQNQLLRAATEDALGLFAERSTANRTE